MQSVISLYNTALARLGGHQLVRINAPDEDAAPATLCRTLFPHVADLALARFTWSFALKRVVLAQKPALGTEPAAYPFRHALPADCVRVGRLTAETGEHLPVPHLLEGRDLLCACAPAVLEYVARTHDPAVWPPDFCETVCWSLAAELATALVNDPGRMQFCREQAEYALGQAMAHDRTAQRPVNHPSAWLEARN